MNYFLMWKTPFLFKVVTVTAATGIVNMPVAELLWFPVLNKSVFMIKSLNKF